MTGNQFPFGEIKDTTLDIKKFLSKREFATKKESNMSYSNKKLIFLRLFLTEILSI